MLHIDKSDLCSSLLGSAASSSAFSQTQAHFAAQGHLTSFELKFKGLFIHAQRRRGYVIPACVTVFIVRLLQLENFLL